MVLGVFFVSFGEITELFFALHHLKFDGGKNSSESRFSEIIIFLACSVSVKHLLMFCISFQRLARSTNIGFYFCLLAANIIKFIILALWVK
jgi:hypothetical protein